MERVGELSEKAVRQVFESTKAFASARRGLRRGGSSKLAIVTTVCGSLLLGYVVARVGGLGHAAAVAAGIMTLAASCFVPMLLLRRRLWFSPALLYAAATFVTFGPTSIPWLGSPNTGKPGVDQVWVGKGLWLVSLGMVMFFIGYAMASSRQGLNPDGSSRIIPQSLASPWLLISIFLAGALLQVALISQSAVGYLPDVEVSKAVASWVQWAQVGTFLANIALIVLAIHAFGNKSHRHLVVLTGLLVIAMNLGFLSGFKHQVLRPALLVGLVYFYYRRRVPILPTAALLLVLILVVPANLGYRASAIRPSIGGRVATAGETLEAALRTPLEDRLALLQQWSSSRLRDIDSVALAMRMTPSPNPYLRGKWYGLAIPILIVPRFVWPSKPVLDVGVMFSHRYAGLPPDTRSWSAVTNQGDLYINFGLFGVALGMLLWGLLGGKLYSWFRRQRSVVSLVAYIVTLQVIVSTEQDFASMFIQGSREILLATLVAWILFRSRSTGSGFQMRQTRAPISLQARS